MSVHFERYHGLGNDYLVLDPRRNDFELTPPRIRLICDRNFGIGSDGILYGPLPDADNIKVRIFNPDGSEAEKSGNGVRIFSKYLFDFGYVRDASFALETVGGKVHVEFLNNDGSLMRVLMGSATFSSPQIPVAGESREVVDEPMCFGAIEYKATCVSVGNPHCVIPMPEISRELALALGPVVETAPQFPHRINMQLLKVLDRENIAIEIFERGAGYTLASGSSSCAAACVAHRLGLIDGCVTVHMRGGKLRIDIRPGYMVYMTGTVNRIGSFTPAPEFLEELALL